MMMMERILASRRDEDDDDDDDGDDVQQRVAVAGSSPEQSGAARPLELPAEGSEGILALTTDGRGASLWLLGCLLSVQYARAGSFACRGPRTDAHARTPTHGHLRSH